MSWNASHYLKFGNERTRAAEDLAVRIQLDAPGSIADLGCGPGNSTRILKTRWPNSDMVGVDSSAEMITAARESFPDQNWLQADLNHWSPPSPFDLVFSNAALQWLPNHDKLIPRLFGWVAPGGALAFQVPSSTYATVRKLVHEISLDKKWAERMKSPRNALTMEAPSFYYDALCNEATKIDLWESEYFHVMKSTDSIVQWIASTGLRPFLAALDDEAEREEFTSRLSIRVAQGYETRADGSVLFPFQRTFVIAYK